MTRGGRVKVLYIAGLGRSGSTILSNSLGQIDGFFSTGEMNFVWKHALLENRLCGCGRPLRECPVWRAVFERAFGGMDRVDARAVMASMHAGARTRHVPKMLTERGRRDLRKRVPLFLEHAERLYRAVTEATGERVIVDSSKEPAYGYAVGMIPSVDLYVLHLVRDPRAAAYSWIRQKEQPDSAEREFMHQKSARDSALLWDAWNVSAEALWRGAPQRYLRLRYEDFVSDPRGSFRKVLAFIREPDAGLPLIGRDEVRLGVTHTVSGNPNRFETGSVKLRRDDRWKDGMSRSDRTTVTALAAPLLLRYGYPLGG
ncbi:Sulfotransferase family [Rubrobacter radiotolerans]|uniref:Sulfotransferase n=1 Tax=Rubrobacter radiotolerans TaxID=42256 RepID=A0A023X5Z9_RUBRA|nr:sulfotransferase [Rubrobacter radiotolerans]AHY47611.1 Sulfotransferase family [Rubrobacter radiotolerans]MDX5895016.1 sulfotransferase [Rubrobacter radiotolerans]SMC07281.1 Sulfotransferase family protein [Rubrobacter radiotolerans DSM 5868]